MVFIISCFSTYSLGYAFAFGSSYFIGIKYYFSSFSIDMNALEANEIKWTLLFTSSSLCSQLAMSGLAERSLQVISWFYAIIISLAAFPVVIGWTIGGGFMQQLGLVDFSGAAAIHIVAGFSSFFAAAILKPRIGRKEPLAIKKGGLSKEIVL